MIIRLTGGHTLFFCLMVVSLLACACNGDDHKDEGNIFLTDNNNYSFVGNLEIPTIKTVSGAKVVDIVFDWSKLTTDLQYHEMDPARDIDNVMLIRIQSMSQEAVQKELSTSELSAEFLDGYMAVPNESDQTSAKITDMTLLGSKIGDITKEYLDDDRVYLLLLATGTTPGVGARMLTFLDPDDASNNTEVNITSSAILDFSADLSSLGPVSVPDEGPWVVNWRDITVDGQGNGIVFESIDGVMLGFYENQSIEDLESEVLDLRINNKHLFEMEFLGGRSVDLADFEGFDGLKGDGTWMFGLTCSSCQNPAPLFLTALAPE